MFKLSLCLFYYMVKPKYSVLLVTFLFLIMLVVRASANGGDFVVSEKIVSIGTKCSDTEFEEAGIFLDVLLRMEPLESQRRRSFLEYAFLLNYPSRQFRGMIRIRV